MQKFFFTIFLGITTSSLVFTSIDYVKEGWDKAIDGFFVFLTSLVFTAFTVSNMDE